MRHFLTITALLACANAECASDGAAGASSTGTLNIRLTVAPEVRLSGLADLQLSSRPGQETRGTTPVCVYLRGASGYQLRASAGSDQGRFALANGHQRAVYRVHYSTGNHRHELQPNLPVTGLRAAGQSSADCSAGGPNGHLEVTLSESARQSLGAGIYSGTLSLTVAPE